VNLVGVSQKRRRAAGPIDIEASGARFPTTRQYQDTH
jgi:hypothetical protein